MSGLIDIIKGSILSSIILSQGLSAEAQAALIVIVLLIFVWLFWRVLHINR
jgi:hypothetical protein